MCPVDTAFSLQSMPDAAPHLVTEDGHVTANNRETVLRRVLTSSPQGYQKEQESVDMRALYSMALQKLLAKRNNTTF